MTEKLIFQQYFENKGLQRAGFTEFHSIHSRMNQFDMHTFLCVLTEHGLRWKLDIRRLKKFQSQQHKPFVISCVISKIHHIEMYTNGHYDNWEQQNVFRMFDKTTAESQKNTN